MKTTKHFIFKLEGTIECDSRADAIDKIENAIAEYLDESQITKIDVIEGP
jgi:hypothetical protein